MPHIAQETPFLLRNSASREADERAFQGPRRRMKWTRKKAYIALALLLLSAAWCSGQQAPDWPRFRGPDGSGVSTETAWNPRALAGNPRIPWTANVGVGLSNFCAQGDRLFTMGWKDRQDSVICLDVSSGKEI